MFNANELDISDIKTEKISAEAYIKYTILPAESMLNKIYTGYKPDESILGKLKKNLDELNESITVVAFGASWCPDCARNIPKMMKIYQKLNTQRFQVYYIGGIKTKPLSKRSQGKYVWAVPPSPPETNDEKFDVTHIPIFYIFNKEGKCIGRIVENPQLTSTIEGDILQLLSAH